MAREASHKNAGTYLSVLSSLASQDLMALAVNVGREVFQRGDKPGPIQVTERRNSEVNFAVVARSKALLRFRVRVQDGKDGASHLKVTITTFNTRQSAMFGVIPNGPKELLGWTAYHTFLQTLEAVIKSKDAKALTSINVKAG